MSAAPLPRNWTSVATRTMSGRQDWELMPRSPITLQQIEIGVAAGLIEKRERHDGKLDVLQVRPRP